MKTLGKLNEAHKLDSSSAPFGASEIQLICFALSERQHTLVKKNQIDNFNEMYLIDPNNKDLPYICTGPR